MPRAATHQGRATDVTTRPWPRPFRSTRTLYAPCTSPESTQPQMWVGETPLIKRTSPGLSHCQEPSGSTSPSPHLANLSLNSVFTLVLEPLKTQKQASVSRQKPLSVRVFRRRVLIYMLCIGVCVFKKNLSHERNVRTGRSFPSW